MPTHYGPKVVTDGLVLALDAADRNSYPGSGTTWTDLSGNGNTGTLVNGVGYNSANFGSLVFDGVNDFVNITDNASVSSVGNGNFSITAFVRVNSSAGTKNIWRRDNFQNQGAENRRIISLGVSSSGFPSFGVYDGNNNGATYSQNICDNNWHYLVGVYESSTKTQYLYENGVLRTQAVYINTQSFNTLNQPWCVGNVNTTYNGEWYTGNIAQVSIYNRALTATEIQQNFNATRSRFSI